MLRVVVVAYRNQAEILALLDSLKDHLKVPAEIVVWDNGGSSHIVRGWQAKNPNEALTLAGDGKNLGFGLGVNAAASLNTEKPWTELLFLNPDALVATDVTPHVIDEFRKLKGICGLRVFDNKERTLRQASARAFPNYLTSLVGREGIVTRLLPRNPWSQKYLGAELNPDTVTQVDWVSGCAVLIDRNHWERVGGFDSRFFLYIEDVDLCRKAQSLDIPVYYFPLVDVIHTIGVSSQQKAFFSDFQHHRGMWLYYWKWSIGAERILAPLIFFAILLRFSLRRLRAFFKKAPRVLHE